MSLPKLSSNTLYIFYLRDGTKNKVILTTKKIPPIHNNFENLKHEKQIKTFGLGHITIILPLK